ncbi:MAG TPA: hypothetical protein VM369_07945 [Candidatus Binatia bacterium]|nr:hypothetical protein [Candidatus Binatia bacterium]
MSRLRFGLLFTGPALAAGCMSFSVPGQAPAIFPVTARTSSDSVGGRAWDRVTGRYLPWVAHDERVQAFTCTSCWEPEIKWRVRDQYIEPVKEVIIPARGALDAHPEIPAGSRRAYLVSVRPSVVVVAVRAGTETNVALLPSTYFNDSADLQWFWFEVGASSAAAPLFSQSPVSRFTAGSARFACARSEGKAACIREQ